VRNNGLIEIETDASEELAAKCQASPVCAHRKLKKSLHPFPAHRSITFGAKPLRTLDSTEADVRNIDLDPTNRSGFGTSGKPKDDRSPRNTQLWQRRTNVWRRVTSLARGQSYKEAARQCSCRALRALQRQRVQSER
jgi:hypothetical protein